MQRSIVLLLLFLFLTACNSPDTRDPDSQYYQIPITTKISLLKPVTIPANQAHILFQGGKIRTTRQGDQYYPFCRFEVRKLSTTAQTVKPDTYTIKRIKNDYDEISGNYLRHYYTQFYLQSAKDSNVLYLICGQWSNDFDISTYLTIKQMQDALGEYIRIDLPEPTDKK